MWLGTCARVGWCVQCVQLCTCAESPMECGWYHCACTCGVPPNLLVRDHILIGKKKARLQLWAHLQVPPPPYTNLYFLKHRLCLQLIPPKLPVSGRLTALFQTLFCIILQITLQFLVKVCFPLCHLYCSGILSFYFVWKLFQFAVTSLDLRGIDTDCLLCINKGRIGFI